ncbi:MAG: hypothetical protein M3163_14925 [Actinomycetota bacterium]|nr:hypothetical protein [Actinomycetota bacterium]
MTREPIIGQRRVLGLLAFFASPFIVLGLGALSSDPLVPFVLVGVLGVSLLFVERLRAVGIGLLAGTATTFGGLLLLGAALTGD